ncbi:acyclic terpene utilization AtuA family protein [Marinivivus vitaminiproducens]|uniref:acyclic terpene utilization AtuA family protein n=1 Tax=Marinivivus vitaminiproducens TaxID=3035935 RepID=UPI0027A0F05C|nr:DUF1446 domain-containing protein [Geminicoccaceae bacterium SCSIO 64248]
MGHEVVRIGCGAGFAGDRSDAAVPIVAELAAMGGPRFLIFETLAERTLALAQIEKRQNPQRGASPALERLLRPILADCLRSGIRIVSNFGAANPRAGAAVIGALAAEAGFPDIRIAIVEGDDLTHDFGAEDFARRETGGDVLAERPAILSANVYLGAREIASGLDQGADVVITGRVADPSLVLGPLLHVFRWAEDDWDRLAAGTLAGHLLECGAQVTGGYFADPGVKDVPGLDEVGYPIGEIDADGRVVVTKPAGTGGRVDRDTVVEQILYEIHDPAAYLTPDVVLDLTEVEVAVIGRDRVAVTGARGHPRPDTLKVTVCVDSGSLAEAEISYAGANATGRARLAIEVVLARMAKRAPDLAIRADAIGVRSLFNDTAGSALADAWPDARGEDVRVRFAAQSDDPAALVLLLDEVEALYCAGPGGGGGVRRRVTPRLRSASCLIERERVRPRVTVIGGPR